MDAREVGYGYALPFPRSFYSHLGHIVFIDDDGVARAIGRLQNDEFFKKLAEESSDPMDFSITTQEYQSLSIALTTGCIDMRPLTMAELAGSVVVDDSPIPQPTTLQTTAGWRTQRNKGSTGLADAIIWGPNISKARLNINRSLVEQWVKDAPSKSPEWTPKQLRGLAGNSRLIVVLEEWISPTWTYVASDRDAKPFALGLASSEEGGTPKWHFLAIPEETLVATYKLGNATLRDRWVIAIAGPSLEPSPRRLSKVYGKLREKITPFLTKVRLHKQKRDKSNLGKVVCFATQDIPNTEETPNPAIEPLIEAEREVGEGGMGEGNDEKGTGDGAVVSEVKDEVEEIGGVVEDEAVDDGKPVEVAPAVEIEEKGEENLAEQSRAPAFEGTLSGEATSESQEGVGIGATEVKDEGSIVGGILRTVTMNEPQKGDVIKAAEATNEGQKEPHDAAFERRDDPQEGIKILGTETKDEPQFVDGTAPTEATNEQKITPHTTDEEHKEAKDTAIDPSNEPLEEDEKIAETELPHEGYLVGEVSSVEPVEEQQKVHVTVVEQTKHGQQGDAGGATEVENQEPIISTITEAEVGDKEGQIAAIDTKGEEQISTGIPVDDTKDEPQLVEGVDVSEARNDEVVEEIENKETSKPEPVHETGGAKEEGKAVDEVIVTEAKSGRKWTMSLLSQGRKLRNVLLKPLKRRGRQALVKDG